jgi:hypothetical protein
MKKHSKTDKCRTTNKRSTLINKHKQTKQAIQKQHPQAPELNLTESKLPDGVLQSLRRIDIRKTAPFINMLFSSYFTMGNDIRFTLNRCKTKKGYNAKANRKIDLLKVAKEYETEMNTPVLLVIKTRCGKTLVHEYGEIIFRECEDEEMMRKTAKEIYSKST